MPATPSLWERAMPATEAARRAHGALPRHPPSAATHPSKAREMITFITSLVPA